MDDGLEGDVAALTVKGEFVNVHPAGADHNQVVPIFHSTSIFYFEKRTKGSSVLLYPVKNNSNCI